MKSKYFFDKWYCGIALINEPKVGSFHKDFAVSGRILIRYYGGEKFTHGFAYIFQNLYSSERPYGNYNKGLFI